jgi:hypothetical protein
LLGDTIASGRPAANELASARACSTVSEPESEQDRSASQDLLGLVERVLQESS